MIRCTQCREAVEELFEGSIHDSWLKLMHYFVLERNQDDITEATYLDMVDALLSLKCAWDKD